MRNIENLQNAKNQIEELQSRLRDAEETLEAIRAGEVDALVINGADGERIYTLKTAEHPYRILVEAMSEGAATLDNSGTILYCNGSLAAILRMPSEKVLGGTLLEFIAPADQSHFEALLRQCRNGSAKGEVQLITSENVEVPVLLSLSPLPLEGLQGVSVVITDLSGQKRQKELIASEKLLRSILDQASEATIVCDPQGRILHASRRAQQVCACNPTLRDFDEILPLHLENEQSEVAFEKLPFSSILAKQELRGIQVQYQRADGETFEMLLSSGLVLDLNGKMMGCVVTLVDITHRKKVEAALLESESRLRAIFDGTYEFIGLLSPDGTLLEGNRSSLNWIGLSREQVIGSLFWETPWWTQTPDVADFVRKAIEHAQNGEAVRQEVTLVNPRGETAVFDFSLHPIFNEHGKVALIVPEGREITDLVKSAREVERRYRDRLKLTEINRALVGKLEFDQVTEIICRAARELTAADGASFVLRDGERVRYTAENAIGPLWKGREFPIEQCISGWSMVHVEAVAIEDIDADPRILHEAYRDTFVKSLLMTPIGPGYPVAAIGVYWASPHKADTYESELLQSLASVADLALSGVRAFEQARHAWAEANQANRLKDEFLATLSHELRNPLNNIVGYSDVLMRSSDANTVPIVRQAAETIHRNASAQAQLINDLLDLSRLQTGKLTIEKQLMSYVPVLRDAVESVNQEALRKDITLSVNCPFEELIIDADPIRIQQIIWNLVSNAVKFTPRGGHVNVTLRRVGSEARLSVEDSGQGIEPQFLPHVFEMFRQGDARTTRSHAGLGIGLALVRQLVDLHGGSINAFSEGVGKGARFTMNFPLLEAARIEPRISSSLSSHGKLRGVHLLLIDDSLDSIEMLRVLLETEGAQVSAATNGQDGLRLAKETNFDLIISDISMPEMDGFKFLQLLRKEIPYYQRVPAIALTGFGRAEDIEKTRQSGFATHLTKPLDFERLTRVVDSVIHGESTIQ